MLNNETLIQKLFHKHSVKYTFLSHISEINVTFLKDRFTFVIYRLISEF